MGGDSGTGPGPAEEEQRLKGATARRLVPLLVLVAAAALVFSQGWHEYLSLQHVAANRDMLKGYIADNYVLTLLGYMAIYVVVVALSLPGGAILTLVGGFLFGWLVAGIATVFAATAGATIIFLIARTSLGEPLAARAGPWLEKLRGGFQENAISYLLFLRLVPVFPFWLVNLAPALLGVTFSTYVIGTLFGIIPGTFAFAFAGVGLDSVIEAQRAAYESCLAANPGTGSEVCEFTLDPSAILTTELLIAFAALGAVALIPVLLKKVRKNRAPQ
jgi:uncharacterized membrane protein YdjX (TVP38/TMEM64 family)